MLKKYITRWQFKTYDAAVVADTLAALGRENVTLGEFIESRKIANYDYDMYSYEHAEGILQIIEDRLKKEGFGGYTHQGGLYAGKGKRKHQVRIYWDPEINQSQVEQAQKMYFARLS